MPSVGIHPPKTPVTKGSNGVAQATLPNVCKMPGPPAPFVPAPLPNIAKSALSPDGFSTTVQIEGDAVAIRGATFESIGDEASKGTGGGLISANTQGPAKFITPGSMTVKIEGKAVHLLGESMLNNCGPGGSPPNTGATMAGVGQGRQAKPPPCPPHTLKWEDLTEDAEKDRKARSEQQKKAHHDREKKNLYDAGQAWKNGDAALGDACFAQANIAEGQKEDVQFEQDVARDAKAKWTGVKFWCTKCNFRGDIDVFTEKGLIKECKNNGRPPRAQIEKYKIVGPIIFGAAFTGIHVAVPSSKMRNAQESITDQGLNGDTAAQPH